MQRNWITRLLTFVVLGGAITVMSGCPLWNRFARDIGVPEWQVAYRPPIREGATGSNAVDSPSPSDVTTPPLTPALSDDEIAAGQPGLDLGSALTLNGASTPILDRRTLDNGLVVEALRVGAGAVCQADSRVVIACRGEFLDGSTFDVSPPEQPYGPWRVDQLIVGMQQGIVGMTVGGLRRLTIPPPLAYGDRAVPGPVEGEVAIPADSTLVYTVELLEVVGDGNTSPPADAAPTQGT